MRAKIKLMKKDAYATLQRNYEDVYKLILEHPDNTDWLYEYIGEDPFEETQYTFEDFDLDYSENYLDYGCENAIKLYEAFKGLPACILYTHYFWTWVIFEKAYKQATLNHQLIDAESVRDSWFPENASRRSIVKSVLAREFMKVKMSVDYNLNDPYELTPYLIQNGQLYDDLSSRNVSDLSQVTRAAIRLEKDLRDNSRLHLTKECSRFVAKTASRIGSVMLVDTMTESEVESILRQRFSDEYPALLSH